MTEKTETEILLAEAANCRKLAQMTVDAAAREALERIACRYDQRRQELEALRTAPADSSIPDLFAIEEMPTLDGDEIRVA